MNRKQRLTTKIAFGLITILLLFPPWRGENKGRVEYAGHHLVLDPPRNEDFRPNSFGRNMQGKVVLHIPYENGIALAYEWLILEVAIVAALAIVAVFLFRSPRSGGREPDGGRLPERVNAGFLSPACRVNTRQALVLLLAFVGITGLGLFPPWVKVFEETLSGGYKFISRIPMGHAWAFGKSNDHAKYNIEELTVYVEFEGETIPFSRSGSVIALGIDWLPMYDSILLIVWLLSGAFIALRGTTENYEVQG